MSDDVKIYNFQSGTALLLPLDADGSGNFYTNHAIKGAILEIRLKDGNTAANGSISLAYSGTFYSGTNSLEIFRINNFSGTEPRIVAPRRLIVSSGNTVQGAGSGNVWAPFYSNDTLWLRVAGGGASTSISGLQIVYM